MNSFPSVPFQRPDGKHLPFELIILKPFGERPRFYESYHRAAFIELWYIQEGVCEQTLDLKPYRLEANTIGIVPRGSITSKGDTRSLGGFLMIFKEEFLTAEQQMTVDELSIFDPLVERQSLALEKRERAEFDTPLLPEPTRASI